MVEGVLAYIGLGSNLDDSLQHCREAMDRLAALPGIAVERVSSCYKTEPIIPDAIDRDCRKELEDQGWYINAVAEIRTTLPPKDLLRALQGIEDVMGRVRSYPGAPRTLDLDLLLYGQEVIQETNLTVPHPEMHKRLFVLEPLCEIASYVIHPVFGVSMRGLKERLGDQKRVERLIMRKEGRYGY